MNTKNLYIGKRGFALYCNLFALSVTRREIFLHLFNPIRVYRFLIKTA